MPLLPLLFSIQILTAPISPTVGLCPPQYQTAHPDLCPAVGPGAYAAQFTAARAPNPLPPLPAQPLPKLDPVSEFTYARVTTPNAPLFESPADGTANINVVDTLKKGFVYVTLFQPTQVGDQTFYKTRTGKYIRATDVSEIKPTDFRGLAFSEQPRYPVGWILKNVRPSSMPGVAPPRKGPSLMRYTPKQIFAIQHVGGWDWFLIGPGQWVEQRNLAKVDLNPPPEGVTGKWIQVNLYEQTLAAYEDSQLVFATLVASGLDKWPTRPGLFHIWARLKVDLMTGSYEADGSDYYYLEAVPWVMYFDGQRALHGEYWHDRLGYKRSHGCVNLATLDARWLFDWTEKGLPVWVYDPTGQTSADAAAGGAP